MKVSQLEVDAASNASVQSEVLLAGLCWGGPRATPPGTPPLPSRPSSSRQACVANPAPKFAYTQAAGRGRCASALAHTASPVESPPPERRPRAIGTLGRWKRGFTNETFPGGGVWAEAQAGADGRPPSDDVGSLSRCVALTTAFPSHRVSGGRPLPFSLFLNGVLWGERKEAKCRPRPSVISATIAV